MTLDDLRRNRNLLFWCLHTLGWSAYLITQSMGALLYDKPASYIKVVLVAAASGFLLSAPLRYVYRSLWRQRPSVIFPAVLLSAWITALAWRALINASYAHFVGDWMPGEPWYAWFAGALSSTYLLLCWSGLYFGIRWYESLQKQREETLEAAALAQEAQVKMLRYQLNPHFLFNTLNAISTLVLDGQGKVANQAIGRLSEFLRHTLDQDPMKKVTLRHELEALNIYLGIEQLRLGDRLRIIARLEHGQLKLAVADDGPGLPVGVELGEGRGVGFRNTRERLGALYGEHHTLAVRFARPGLRLEITLPFEKAVEP